MLVYTTRNYMSMLVGLILFIVGGIPVLNYFGAIAFTLPGFLTNIIADVVFWIIAVMGMYIVIDGFMEAQHSMWHGLLLLMGVIFIIIGLIPILNNRGVIPFGFDFLKSLIVYNTIITIEGILLLIGGFTER
jgi:hypothetical protein